MKQASPERLGETLAARPERLREAGFRAPR
jgi:hypothetical protein